MATARTQLMVTSHSPEFVNALSPEEVWILDRAEDGFTQPLRASEIEEIAKMTAHGSQLGDLWMEGYFGRGDPLRAAQN